MNPLWEKANSPRGTKGRSIVYFDVREEKGEEKGEMQREGSLLGTVDWKERGSPRIRPRDKGMTTVACVLVGSRLFHHSRSVPSISLASSLFFFFHSADERRANRRKREADVGMRIEVADCTYSRGPFVPRGPSCCAPWDLSGENCLLGTTTTDEPFDRNITKFCVPLIVDRAHVVRAVISLLIPRLRGYLNCSPRRSGTWRIYGT